MDIKDLARDAKTLLDFTKGANCHFHEPDEQGFVFNGCVGTKLDNAMGDYIELNALQRGYQEVVILLENQQQVEDCHTPSLAFNLATLIALARHGAKALLNKQKDGKCVKAKR